MPKNLSVFLREAADRLRALALRAPDMANELRRLADELEHDAERLGRDDSREAQTPHSSRQRYE